MKTVRMGHSGIDVSALCLGTMNFGTRTDEETSFNLLDTYVAAGGNFLDTSNNYAFWAEGGQGGESELVIGRWMRERGNRERLTIATKVGAQPLTPGSGLSNVEGLSSQAIEAAVEGSLRRLGIETIDLYYAHVDDRRVPIEETLEAFDRLVRAGKVRALGCSNIVTWRIAEAQTAAASRGLTPYCATQQRFSYLRPRENADFGTQSQLGSVSEFGIEFSASTEFIDRCHSRSDMVILAYSPLLRGAYAGRELNSEYRTAENEQRMTSLRKVAEELGVTPNQVVLAWLLQVPPATIPILAASSVAQLTENMRATRLTIEEQQLRLLGSF
ncbi:aldo/keto reductase [Mesorhizobium sp. M0960]|uniref:aldo/keto reductase n=1 Tax=Mesorhizobium sp. M0960 TaxID=2957035 RepID=UPI00333C99D6